MPQKNNKTNSSHAQEPCSGPLKPHLIQFLTPRIFGVCRRGTQVEESHELFNVEPGLDLLSVLVRGRVPIYIFLLDSAGGQSIVSPHGNNVLQNKWYNLHPCHYSPTHHAILKHSPVFPMATLRMIEGLPSIEGCTVTSGSEEWSHECHSPINEEDSNAD